MVEGEKGRPPKILQICNLTTPLSRRTPKIKGGKGGSCHQGGFVPPTVRTGRLSFRRPYGRNRMFVRPHLLRGHLPWKYAWPWGAQPETVAVFFYSFFPVCQFFGRPSGAQKCTFFHSVFGVFSQFQFLSVSFSRKFSKKSKKIDFFKVESRQNSQIQFVKLTTQFVKKTHWLVLLVTLKKQQNYCFGGNHTKCMVTSCHQSPSRLFSPRSVLRVLEKSPRVTATCN